MGKALAKNTVMIIILAMVILVAVFMCCLEKDVLNEIFNYIEAGFKLVPVTGIAFEQSEYTISSISSDSYQLKLVIYPENASNKKITWTSSDPLIAKVDSDGNIYGKALGTVIIKAKSVDGNFKASCQVTVSNIVTYEDYIINVVTKSIIDYIGADQIVNIPSVIGGVEIETVLSKAFNSDSIFSVSFPYSIKKIESEAFAECENINVIELGSDVLVEANAFCDFNDIDDLLEVYAAGGSGIYYQEYDGWRKIDEILHVSNLTLDTEMITIPANKSNISYNIYSFVEPENAHIYGVSWTSSDTSVVTIDSYDTFCSLYGVSAGTAVVTATSADGRYEAKCIVNVTETVLENGFVFDPETGTIIEYKGTQSNLVIPSSIGGITVECIGERAICLNDYIKTIEIPSTVVTLGKQSIYFCDNLESVIFQEGSNLKEIEEYTFTSTAITELLLPSSLTKINESVFDSWNDLRYIEIGSDVKIKINERLSNDTNNFINEYKNNGAGIYYKTEYVWKKAVMGTVAGITLSQTSLRVTIKENEWSNYYSLSAKVYPDTAITKDVVWSSSNNLIADVYENGTFLVKSPGTVTIQAATIDGGLTAACEIEVYTPIVENGFAFDTETNTIVGYTGDETEIIIPAYINNIPVLYIGENAFNPANYNEEWKITSVSFQEPSNVIEIKELAFRDSLLERIQLPSSLKIIGNYAFVCNHNLQSISIPSNVTLIKDGAFSSCYELSSLSFDENSQLIEIGNSAFSSCPLRSLQLPEKLKSIGDNAFSQHNFSTLKIPESVEYIGASFDNRSLFIVEIGSGVQLGEGAFDIFWDTFREAYNKGGAGMYTRNKKYDWVKIDKIINVTGMNIFENSFNMPLTDEWVALHLDIFPLDATNKKVVLTSSNPSVVSVSQPTYFREAGHDAYFYIHSESAGTAIITATSEDGGYTSKCIITVYPW